MARGRRCTGGFYCDCNFHRKNREAIQSVTERSSSSNNLGLIGDAAIAGASLVGLATNPVQPPSTDQLSDVYQSQVKGYGQSIEEASRSRGRGTSQKK